MLFIVYRMEFDKTTCSCPWNSNQNCTKLCQSACIQIAASGNSLFTYLIRVNADMTKKVLFTPPAYVLCGKVMFSVVSVYLPVNRGSPCDRSHGTPDLPPPMALAPLNYHMGTPTIPAPYPYHMESPPGPAETYC